MDQSGSRQVKRGVRRPRVRMHPGRGQPVFFSSNSNEWYTPARYMDAVRRLMGEIDLDPASCIEANRVVRAKHFYTIRDDGRRFPWPGRIFLNPPYGFWRGKSSQGLWSRQLIEQYEAGITKEAVLLLTAATERQWFQALWRYLICFTDHRIAFNRPGGEAMRSLHGSVFVYFGNQPQRFADLFRSFGTLARRVS